MDRGEVGLPVRIPDVDANPGTEVGRLGLAVNRMLDHIATALSTRQASEKVGCGSSSPTPAMNSGPRWPPSEAIPNWHEAETG